MLFYKGKSSESAYLRATAHSRAVGANLKMKTAITILTFLTIWIAAGQAVKTKPHFVSDYFNDQSLENFEKILNYHDSINDNFIEVGHCWKYCIDIYVDSNQVLLNGNVSSPFLVRL